MGRKRTYNRKCGCCGIVLEQSKMRRTDLSVNGWLCEVCFEDVEDAMSDYYYDILDFDT